jgi:HEPN domain-containing protein
LDIKKQIEYWIATAEDDLEAVHYLIANNKTIQAMFFCHLAVEKTLKALVVKAISDVPPKIHNLKRLAELADIKLTDEQNSLLNDLMVFQLEGRYPEYYPEKPTYESALKLFDNSKILIGCLKQML